MDLDAYEAYYRIWLGHELARGVGGDFRERAHVRAIEECQHAGPRRDAAATFLKEKR